MDSIMSLGFAVVGTVELIKRIFDKDFRAAATIVAAAVVGGIGGYFLGVPPLQGILIGLQGSGFITTASYLSSKPSTPAVVPTV